MIGRREFGGVGVEEGHLRHTRNEWESKAKRPDEPRVGSQPSSVSPGPVAEARRSRIRES